MWEDEGGDVADWILRTDYGLDGDSLSYEDRMERRGVEEERRAKERQLMEEGRSDPVMSPHLLYLPGSFGLLYITPRTQSALLEQCGNKRSLRRLRCCSEISRM